MIRLFKGNNLDFIKTIPDNSIDFIYTDPPYLYEEAQKKKMKHLENENVSKVSLRKNAQAKLMKMENLEIGYDQESYFKEFVRIQKDTKEHPFQIMIWCNDYQLRVYLNLIYEYGLKFKLIHWIKPNPMPQNNPYITDKETCIYIYKKSILSYLNEFDSRRTYFMTRNDRECQWHPTTKPYKIVLQQILKHAKKGDIVFDPFLGSGTTALACMNNDIDLVGCELSNNFFDKMYQRLWNELDIVSKMNPPIEIIKEW